MSNNKHLTKGSPMPDLPDDDVLRLFSMRFCPYAHRVQLVLDAKKIPHRIVYINLHDKPEWFTEYSPLGKVPALQVYTLEGKRFTITESLIIADYLEDMYPKPNLYPKDPLKKAQDKILIERFNPVIDAMYKIFVNKEVSPGVITDVSNGLDIFEKELKSRGTPFFGGNNPGMLDYMIWPWCERSDMIKYLLNNKYEMDKERFEQLLKWRDLMINDDTVNFIYLDGETHAKFMKSRREGNPDYDMLAQPTKRQRTC